MLGLLVKNCNQPIFRHTLVLIVREMTKEELKIKIKLLEAENRRLKARITKLENAVKNFSEAIGEEI